MPLGVNTDNLPPRPGCRGHARLVRNSIRSGNLLLYVGRLAQEKNTRTLFEAFALLAQRQPENFHLLVIGDGPQREQLERTTSDNPAT